MLAEAKDAALPIVLDSDGGDFDAALALGRLIRSKGLDTAQIKQFVMGHLSSFKKVTRSKLDELVFPLLPSDLTDEQRKRRVENLLREMRAKDGTIAPEGRGPSTIWRLT